MKCFRLTIVSLITLLINATAMAKPSHLFELAYETYLQSETKGLGEIKEMISQNTFKCKSVLKEHTLWDGSRAGVVTNKWHASYPNGPLLMTTGDQDVGLQENVLMFESVDKATNVISSIFGLLDTHRNKPRWVTSYFYEKNNKQFFVEEFFGIKRTVNKVQLISYSSDYVRHNGQYWPFLEMITICEANAKWP